MSTPLLSLWLLEALKDGELHAEIPPRLYAESIMEHCSAVIWLKSSIARYYPGKILKTQLNNGWECPLHLVGSTCLRNKNCRFQSFIGYNISIIRMDHQITRKVLLVMLIKSKTKKRHLRLCKMISSHRIGDPKVPSPHSHIINYQNRECTGISRAENVSFILQSYHFTAR